jgi:hypothetical protein
MDWFDFERGVEARSGHGSHSRLLNKKDGFIYGLAVGERRSRPERRRATLGRAKRPREKQTKTDAKLHADLFVQALFL